MDITKITKEVKKGNTNIHRNRNAELIQCKKSNSDKLSCCLINARSVGKKQQI
jgi:hypothetical protein